MCLLLNNRKNIIIDNKGNTRALPYYFICWSISASPFWSDFRPIPALYAYIPDFYSKICLLSATVGCFTYGLRMRRGRVGSHMWQIIIHRIARKIILARNLMCWPEARFRVAFRLSVTQGTGKSSSTGQLFLTSESIISSTVEKQLATMLTT